MQERSNRHRIWIDLRSLTLSSLIAIPASVVAFFVLGSGIGPTQQLHPAFFFPISLLSGALYAVFASKRRHDLDLSHIGGGGAVAAILPACILSVAGSSTGGSILDIRGMMNARIFILWLFLTAFGAFFGCIGALVLAMVHEARVIRRHRANDAPRPMPKRRQR